MENESKNICALLLGSASLLGREANHTEEKKTLYIPAECKEILSLSLENGSSFNLTCKDGNGKEIFYRSFYDYYNAKNNWDRWEIMR